MTTSRPEVAIPDADMVADITLRCPSVARMSAGSMSEVATYLPNRRVHGVRLKEDRVEVHVAAHWGVPLPGVGDEIRRALAPFFGGRSIDVFIEDIDEPPYLLRSAPAGDHDPA